MNDWRRTPFLLALLAALSIAALMPSPAPATASSVESSVAATGESCTPCRRPQCVALCGSQGPAFCELDPVTGCSVCACNG